MSALGFILGGPLGGAPDIVVAPLPPTPTPTGGGASALPRDLRLDADGDLDVSTGDLLLTSEGEAIGQALDISLGMVKGEWFLDEDEGLDLYGVVLVSNPSDALIQEDIRQRSLGVEGVTGVSNIELAIDRTARELVAQVTVVWDGGELTRTVRLAA